MSRRIERVAQRYEQHARDAVGKFGGQNPTAHAVRTAGDDVLVEVSYDGKLTNDKIVYVEDELCAILVSNKMVRVKQDEE